MATKDTRNFVIINLNARSIINKVDDLEHISTEYDPDIVVITESRLHDLVMNDEIVPPGYNIFRKDRGSRGGGVAIIANHDLHCTKIKDSSETESVWCKVKLSNIDMIDNGTYQIMIGAIYQPPNSGFDFLDKLNEFLVKTRANTRNVIISGDFNVPSIDWDALMPGTQDVTLCSTPIDMTFLHGLTQIVKSYARAQGECKSVLDLF